MRAEESRVDRSREDQLAEDRAPHVGARDEVTGTTDRPSDSRLVVQDQAWLRGWLGWSLLGGVAVCLLVQGIDLLWLEVPGQSPGVRWIRLAADHPWRTWLAGSAFWAAIWPSNRGFGSASDGADGEGTRFDASHWKSDTCVDAHHPTARSSVKPDLHIAP